MPLDLEECRRGKWEHASGTPRPQQRCVEPALNLADKKKDNGFKEIIRDRSGAGRVEGKRRKQGQEATRIEADESVLWTSVLQMVKGGFFMC